MSAYDLAAWSDFFVAEAGASAALTGLVIVAISINIPTILKYPHLPSRALESIVPLAGILILSTLGVVPDQTVQMASAEIASVGGLMWAVITILQAQSFRRRQAAYDDHWARVVLGQFAAIPIVAAGVSLAAGQGGGLYWIVPGVVLGLVGGITNTWVLLIEILR